MATEFDEYDYLEHSIEATAAAASNGGSSNDRRSRRHRDGENGSGEKERSEKRHRSGEKEREREREKERDKERERERERERRSGGERHRSGDRDGERRKEREVDVEKERRKERDREREMEKSLSRSRRHEEERGLERGLERDGEHQRSRSRDRREREREGFDGRRTKEKKESDPEVDLERDQRTVFAYQMPLRATERDVYEFFSRAGKVRDVRLIMDRNSRRSKGVGYIEFYDAMSVPSAIALCGQILLGQPVMVKPSEAEKNLVPSTSGATGAAAARKIYVGNLPPIITEENLRQVFEAFGPVELVQLPTEAGTRLCKGYGFIQFAQAEHAKAALTLDGKIEILQRTIKVSSVTDHLSAGNTTATAADLDDDDGGGLSLNAHSRTLLMQKLDRTGTASSIAGSLGIPVLNGTIPPQAAVTMPIVGQTTIAAVAPLPGSVLEPIGQPSECILLKNMFDPETETDPDFDLDIKEDVEEECSKFGAVRHTYVDKNSKGHVYLRFDSVAAAMKCQSTMHGRFFAGKPISATYMTSQEYEAKFRGVL